MLLNLEPLNIYFFSVLGLNHFGLAYKLLPHHPDLVYPIFTPGFWTLSTTEILVIIVRLLRFSILYGSLERLGMRPLSKESPQSPLRLFPKLDLSVQIFLTLLLRPLVLTLAPPITLNQEFPLCGGPRPCYVKIYSDVAFDKHIGK